MDVPAGNLMSRMPVLEQPLSSHATSVLRVKDGVVVADADTMQASTAQRAVSCVQSFLGSHVSKFSSRMRIIF